MIRAALALWLMLAALPAAAQQGWGNIDGLLFQNLTQSGRAEAPYWLPDRADPAAAQRALGVVYEHIPGSAGSVSIAVGVFVQQDRTWLFAGPVQGLFGQSPRDAVFAPAHVDLTTTMPGPNDPRCCPTQPTRWRVDLRALQAVQLP